MKQKRLVSMIGALVLIISAVVLITGCPQPNGSKDKKENTTTKNGGNTVGVQFPDDLRNTSWSHKTEIGGMVTTSIILEFGTNTLKYTANGIVANYTIISATKGGKIEISAGAGPKVVLCESYSISGSTLTISGGMHSIGLKYTKQ
ncbi:hypothetical protein [Treponema phagedenis]|uniref:Lipoprotein n=1 Tax=Treponema phagedenis TaxID=162 RepID=A0AAE6IW65_TREPH|nr:hypothetical protein [Treponema phagedenis]QEJ94291.1 hypothetical protein FUT79_03090 [Treponema phagedenis]QEJ99070.1 hypothetical protein FUT82_14425 [Treponema phagedenis]QEK04581.1 hypothetical protein FUT83_12735 [Treponema phagedenis]QEK10237.1 hypothetical protein FUT81_12870 [Treponema phagedenis]